MNAIPKLQPPGAGLPMSQRLFVKLWLGPVVSRRTPRVQCRESYERLTRKLIERIEAVPADRRGIRVLVDPIPGLEDSSRFWSLNEVLEHLLIVSRNIEAVILSLGAGVVPDAKADIAKLKPSHAERDSLTEFAEYAPELLRRVDERLAGPGMSFDSRARFRHPWFGPMTVRQWYWLLGSHQGIHLRQAKGIIAGLRVGGAGRV